ncbi:HNH endonuclease [Candidatus Pacearchaeota archaeon]|nr:HNH endonuclease [Candidatus Pacearchaeota archaeon]
MTYQEKLRDPRWQRKRLEIMERDKWECKKCGNDTKTLHVHHRNYENYIDPWDYPNDTLVTLCDSCHTYEHKRLESSNSDTISWMRHSLFSDQMTRIAWSFKIMPFCASKDFVTDALCWFIRDSEMQKLMVSEYKKYLDKNTGSDY